MGLATKIDNFGNKVVNNRTFKYLVPPLGYYGRDFRSNLKKLDVKAFGVGDAHLNESLYFSKLPCIYILYDSSIKERQKDVIVNWFYHQDYFVDNLYLKSHTNPFKLLIILFPVDRFPYAYKNFFLGRYSKMYSKEDIDKYFNEEKTISILKNDKEAIKNHIKRVNEKFRTNISIRDVDSKHEADFKIEKKEEFFNI